MKEIKGDLIKLAKNNTFDAIIHGCNCFNTFRAGIAKQIKQEFPEAYIADRKTIYGDKNKLGSYSSVYIDKYKLHVINAYTQYAYGSNKRNADYNAIKTVFKSIERDFQGLSFGIPMIGCGLGKGNWSEVYNIINPIMENENITLIIYKE